MWHFNGTKFIAFLIVLLLPFWALPILPGTFRPISVYLCVPIGVIALLQIAHQRRICLSDLTLLLFAFFSVSLSCIYFLFLGGDFLYFITAVVLFIFGILSFFGFRYIFDICGLSKFMQYFYIAICIVVVIGWFDLLSWVGLLPESIRSYINLAVAGKSSSRIILTTAEPAWASRLSLCLLPFAYFFFRYNKTLVNAFLLFSLVTFFFLSFSISGVVVLLAAMGLFVIRKISLKVLFQAGLCISLIMVGLYFTFQKLKEGGGYFVSRFEKVSEIGSYESIFTLETIAAVDGSALIRIGYPWIAAKVTISNPQGIGLGRYPDYFNNEIVAYGPIVTEDIAVASHIKEKNADQRSFFIRVVNETGGLSILLILFYIQVHIKLSRFRFSSSERTRRLYTTLLISMFIAYGNMIQFSSYIFPFYWLIPALILGIADKEGSSEKLAIENHCSNG